MIMHLKIVCNKLQLVYVWQVISCCVSILYGCAHYIDTNTCTLHCQLETKDHSYCNRPDAWCSEL